MLGACLLLAALAPITSAAESAPQRVEASMVLIGTITVNPDGSVKDYRIHRADEVPPGVLGLVRQTIAGWRFEPVLDAGKPVTAETGMTIRVVADVTDRTHPAFRVAGAAFGCSAYQTKELLPDACPPGQMVTYAGEQRAPVYPRLAMRDGGEGTVYLLVEVGPDGHVARVATQQVDLAHKVSRGTEQQVRQVLASASEDAARTWTFTVPSTGRHADGAPMVVRIPVRFSFNRKHERKPAYGRWDAYLPGPVHDIPWSDSDGSDGSSNVVAGDNPFLRDRRFVLKDTAGSSGDRS